ncbi:hypothetical protein [Providencia alcalifaciens]|uniref:hypothetical protein n=1 Tax=Providencia alcalifaciens TaxID=126385 RepID=UPI002B05D826|nr:hypothetical protein [Providencia alcalifaciens]
MLTSRQFSLSVICMAFLAVIHIIILQKNIDYPMQLFVLGMLLIVADGLNIIIFENQGAFTVLNLVIVEIFIVSILRVIGWV